MEQKILVPEGGKWHIEYFSMLDDLGLTRSVFANIVRDDPSTLIVLLWLADHNGCTHEKLLSMCKREHEDRLKSIEDKYGFAMYLWGLNLGYTGESVGKAIEKFISDKQKKPFDLKYLEMPLEKLSDTGILHTKWMPNEKGIFEIRYVMRGIYAELFKGFSGICDREELLKRLLLVKVPQ